MCVRYTLHDLDKVLAAIARALGYQLAPPAATKPRYNVTLTTVMPVVALASGKPEVRGMRWGFAAANTLLPNAKAETVATLPSFREGAAHRRCLIPANGFYEWQDTGSAKLPHLFTLRDDEPFAFAGIWDRPAGDRPETFCLLTTVPNETVAPIHNRMPVILTPETMARWIGDRPLPEAELRVLTQPIRADRMSVRPVSRFVSHTRNEGPGCLAPPDAPEPELF
jgi:putative SOS response-associated peptidase YedK